MTQAQERANSGLTVWQVRRALAKGDLTLPDRVYITPIRGSARDSMEEAFRCAGSWNRKVREGTLGLFRIMVGAKRDDDALMKNIFSVLTHNAGNPPTTNNIRKERRVTAAVGLLCEFMDDEILREQATDALVIALKAARESHSDDILVYALNEMRARSYVPKKTQSMLIKHNPLETLALAVIDRNEHSKKVAARLRSYTGDAERKIEEKTRPKNKNEYPTKIMQEVCDIADSTGKELKTHTRAEAARLIEQVYGSLRSERIPPERTAATH